MRCGSPTFARSIRREGSTRLRLHVRSTSRTPHGFRLPGVYVRVSGANGDVDQWTKFAPDRKREVAP
jgi:hypothetical protein